LNISDGSALILEVKRMDAWTSGMFVESLMVWITGVVHCDAIGFVHAK
jgi:hypothetical protein